MEHYSLDVLFSFPHLSPPHSGNNPLIRTPVDPEYKHLSSVLCVLGLFENQNRNKKIKKKKREEFEDILMQQSLST